MRSTPRLPIVVALGGIACAPDLPAPERDDPSSEPSAVLEPAGPLDQAPPVLWLRVVGALDLGIAPAEVVLAEGSLSERSLSQLAKGDPSEALTDRLVPATVFEDGRDLVLAPDAILPPGSYALGLTRLEWSASVEIAGGGPPVLRRMWPLADRPGLSAWWCGIAERAPEGSVITLAPAGPEGGLVRGSPLGHGHQCLRFSPTGAPAIDGPLHPPPFVADGSSGVLLDPMPLWPRDGSSDPLEEATCEPGEIDFGPGCARVEDDRLTVRAPIQPALWIVSTPGLDRVFSTRDGEAVLVRGLEPESDLPFTVEVLAEDDAYRASTVHVRTLAAMPHVVLSEVYADAIGPEPEQEWVELYNDGLAPVDLEGFILGDIGGETPLPPHVIAPGGYALIVGEGFDAAGEYDVGPAAGTPLVWVPRVGKSGLSNQGEPLKLLDASGAVVSRFPGLPKPKPGISVARLRLDLPDDAPEAFGLASAGPTPGAANGSP